LQLRKHITGADGIEAHVAVHAAPIDARVQGTHAPLHDAIAVVPRREPLGLPGSEDGDNRFAQGGGQVRWEGIMAEHGIGTVQSGDEGGKVGCM
jgi:hypothetical protein